MLLSDFITFTTSLKKLELKGLEDYGFEVGFVSKYMKAFAVVVVLIVVIVLALGVSIYLFPPPTPTPTPTPSPTPTPGPKPPLKFRYGVESASSAGFNRTTSEFQGDATPVLVLPPGGSGTIPVKLSSTGGEDYTISLSTYLAGETGVGFEGVTYTFSPSTISLKAGDQVESILTIDVDSEAPTAYYETSIMANAEEGGSGIGEEYHFHILVSPYTPTYIYRLHVPTPGAPLPTPGPTAPTETPLPGFELVAGEKISFMFFILNIHEPIDLDVTSPPELGFDIVSDPIESVPRPKEDKIYLLTITTNPDISEDTYKMTVTGNTGSYTFEWAFHISVKIYGY